MSKLSGDSAQLADTGSADGEIASEPANELRLYPIFTGVFVASLLLANVTSQKIFAIGPFSFPGGAVIFPISFIFDDILTETYGYARSRRVIWTGFVCQIMATITYAIVEVLPAASFWPHEEAYDAILGVVWRITIASMAAYFAGEFVNSIVLSKMKYNSEGRTPSASSFVKWYRQAWRFVLSTIVGQAVDTTIFSVVAFAGLFGLRELAITALSLYLFKVIYELLLTPFTVNFANWVKRVENIDHLDMPATTRYTPFRLWE